MKLIPVSYYGFTAMDRRFSSPMLPWIVSEIRKRDFCEKLSLGVEDGILQAYNPDFELQFSHKVWQVTRFSQADQDPTTFLYLMRDDHDTLLYCYLFQAKKSIDVLHLIDKVLDPLTKIAVPGATALDFVQHYKKWSIGGESVSKFYNKILQHGQEKLYRADGGHTFFIPVDRQMNDNKLQNIDNYIIQGHTVPNYVAFLRPTPKDFIIESASNGDYIYIVLSIHERDHKYFVKSYTVQGNSKHRRGESIAEILVANIPVANGVVHLISQPLAVFERELKPFPYLPTSYKISADPTLNVTNHLGEKYGLNEELTSDSSIFTYFAPRDKGWGPYLNEDDLEEIMGRHLVMSTSRFTMEKLHELSRGNGTILNTVSGPIKFEVVKSLNDYYIKWKRKTIRVYRADYECSDGIVHVIDEPFAEDLNSEEDASQKLGIYGKLKKMVASIENIL